MIKLKKFFTYSILTFFASFLVLSTPVLAAETTAVESEIITTTVSTVVPYSDIIRYRYKEENGKLYRRLYNYTRDEWAEPYWHLVG